MQLEKNVLLLLFLSLSIRAQATKHRWTWLYKKDFTPQQLYKNKQKQQLIFSKTELPQFTQLIFSWNALRPQKGYLSISGQIRDAKTKQWHDWHKMIDWGKKVQRSYFNTADSGTQYCHVRLEMPEKKVADGLRIKIESTNGADLSCLRTISANIANLLKFKHEPRNAIVSLPSVYIQHVPQWSQMVLDHPKADVFCSPTSCSMLSGFLTKKVINPISFAENAHDTGLDAYGSWPFNIAHAFEQCGGKSLFRVVRLNSFVALHQKLTRNIPVVVSVRGALKGAPKEYNNGHLLVVVGWNRERKKVICHDPAFETNDQVYTEYDLDGFCTAWEKSRRLAYIAEPLRFG